MEFLSLVIVLIAGVMASYGSYLLWRDVIIPAFGGDKMAQSKLGAFAVMTFVAANLFTGGHAFAQSDTISFDLDEFFESLNTYIPVFMAIFGVVGGIAAAISLVRFIINSVINAFNGGRI
jgi:hypothetical protein